MSTLNVFCPEVPPPVTCTDDAFLNASRALVTISVADSAATWLAAPDGVPAAEEGAADVAPALPAAGVAGESSPHAAASSAAADTASRTRNGRTERSPRSGRKAQSTSRRVRGRGQGVRAGPPGRPR